MRLTVFQWKFLSPWKVLVGTRRSPGGICPVFIEWNFSLIDWLGLTNFSPKSSYYHAINSLGFLACPSSSVSILHIRVFFSNFFSPKFGHLRLWWICPFTPSESLPLLLFVSCYPLGGDALWVRSLATPRKCRLWFLLLAQAQFQEFVGWVAQRGHTYLQVGSLAGCFSLNRCQTLGLLVGSRAEPTVAY